MWLPDTATMQVATAWIAVAAAGLGLVSLSAGLYSMFTGKDHWPTPLRRLRLRTPASEEDQRRHGLFMVLNAAAVLIIIMGSSIATFSIGDHRIGEPLNTLRFVVTLIGLAGAMACVGGAYRVSLTVRYIVSRNATETNPSPPS